MRGLLEKNLQFILFGGKGGVGKTTMATASAIEFAKHNPKKKILVFTTDPAPSLADSFVQDISDEPKKIKSFDNLYAMEINAQTELQKFKKKYGDDILDILQEGTYLSNEETEEMFSLDIPGLDEVMGLKKITDFMDTAEGGARKDADGDADKRGNKNQKFDMYILDTAPTGHTLRLLTMPELLDDWIKFLARLRWKYHAMVNQLSRGRERRVTKADEFLLEMKKTVKKVQNLLRDSDKTTFVAVTIPEAMGVEETKDLIENLKKSKIPIEHIIVNNIVPTDGSSFMKLRRKVQNGYIDELKRSFADMKITEVELQAGEIRGKDSLTALGEKLFS